MKYLLNRRQGTFRRVLRFSLTGASGIPIDLGIVALVYALSGSWLIANVSGYLVAVTWNFVINYSWTWERPSGSVRRMYAKYLNADAGLFFVRVMIVAIFVDAFDVPVLPSSLVGILAVAAATFWIADEVVFQEDGSDA